MRLSYIDGSEVTEADRIVFEGYSVLLNEGVRPGLSTVFWNVFRNSLVTLVNLF